MSGRPTPLVSGLEDNQIQGVFENTGTSNFTLQMRQTDDRSVSGTRTDIGAALNIVPGGRRTVTFSPWQSYLETYCTAGGGQVKAQLSSKIKWEQMAFDKLDTFYPPQIWQVDSEEGI